MFADTDFLLALLKESDWLKIRAVKILEENKDKIKTSISVMIEIALVSKRLKMDTMKIFTNTFELVNVDEETYDTCMRAAFYMKKFKLNVFDSFHAAFCFNEAIISSDSTYDKVGLIRVQLCIASI